MRINLLRYLFLLGFFGQLLLPSAVFAQEATKQRTTGTYLPVLAQEKFSQQFDANQGGSVSLDDGGAEVVIPDNFYNKAITFSVRRVKWEDNDIIPSLKNDGESFVGKDVFEITAIDPETKMPILKFDKNFKIIFRYFDSEVEGFNEDSVKIRYFDRLGQEWKEIPSQVNLDSNSIEIYVDHLSLFAMTGELNDKNATAKKDKNEENTGMPLWQKVLLIVGLLILSGIGGWFVYTTYTQAKYEMPSEGGFTVAGGSQPTDGINNSQAPISAEPNSQKPDSISNSSGDKKTSDQNQSDENNEIWIDF